MNVWYLGVLVIIDDEAAISIVKLKYTGPIFWFYFIAGKLVPGGFRLQVGILETSVLK